MKQIKVNILMKHHVYSRRSFFRSMSFQMTSAISFLPIFQFFDRVSFNSDMEVREKDDLTKIREMLRENNPLIWVFTGDSITQGAKHTHGLRAYPEIFAERVKWEMRRRRDIIINTAISGNTTKDIIDDFNWRIKQCKPNVVSLMIGTNDCANNQVSLINFEDNLNKLLSYIKDTGAIPILHTPNTIDKNEALERSGLAKYVAIIQNISIEKEIILIDNWSFWNENLKRTKLKKWLDDPIHPNGNGHVQIAHLIFKKFRIFDPSAPTCSEKI